MGVVGVWCGVLELHFEKLATMQTKQLCDFVVTFAVTVDGSGSFKTVEKNRLRQKKKNRWFISLQLYMLRV